VQVKGNEPEQLWSVSMLCQREQKAKKADRVGTSILERSLAYDRCREPCCFRIVTTRPVNAELRVLIHPLGSASRAALTSELAALADEVTKNVGEFRSANGRCCREWVASATWQEAHSPDGVRQANLIELMKLVKEWNSILFIDQLESVYDNLLFKVNQAALVRHEVNPLAKKLHRDTMTAWIKNEIARAEHPVSPGSGAVLKAKMKDAGIEDDLIANSVEMRLQYRIEALAPQYQELGNRRVVDRRVAGVLHLLLVKFDAGQTAANSVEFHALCLERLSELPNILPIFPKPSMEFLFGCMYNIADRCGHRFRRPTG
jgi:Cap4 dsDNA endonuclease